MAQVSSKFAYWVRLFLENKYKKNEFSDNFSVKENFF